MTAREAAHRYSAIGKRAAVGFATTLLHHRVGHDRFIFNDDPFELIDDTIAFARSHRRCRPNRADESR